jgi:hypothetical protein
LTAAVRDSGLEEVAEEEEEEAEDEELANRTNLTPCGTISFLR